MPSLEVAQEIYAAPFEDFLSVRTAQVKEAKAAGDKELARQIGGLRKPTRSAWLVNLLARAAPEDLDELLQIGTALRDAQANLDGAELRRLSTARHRAVDALSRQAAELGAEAGYTATDAVRQEVAQTLSAALADPEQAEAVRHGTLSAAVSYGGFGPFELGAAPPEPVEGPESGDAVEAAEAGGESTDAEDQIDEDQIDEAVREAEAAWRRAQEELAEAEEEAERATAEADALADQVDELRSQLEAAEKAESEARRTARSARKQVDELTAAERSARAAAKEAGKEAGVRTR
jgi:hypothetical protein